MCVGEAGGAVSRGAAWRPRLGGSDVAAGRRGAARTARRFRRRGRAGSLRRALRGGDGRVGCAGARAPAGTGARGAGTGARGAGTGARGAGTGARGAGTGARGAGTGARAPAGPVGSAGSPRRSPTIAATSTGWRGGQVSGDGRTRALAAASALPVGTRLRRGVRRSAREACRATAAAPGVAQRGEACATAAAPRVAQRGEACSATAAALACAGVRRGVRARRRDEDQGRSPGGPPRARRGPVAARPARRAVGPAGGARPRPGAGAPAQRPCDR